MSIAPSAHRGEAGTGDRLSARSGVHQRSRAAGTPPARLAIDTPSPGVKVIRVDGVLSAGSATRLLRLVDSQLALASSGQAHLRAVILDLTSVQAVQHDGAAPLHHIGYACNRRGIEVAVAGGLGPLLSSSLSLRRRLRDLRTFPTVASALGVLKPHRAFRDDYAAGWDARGAGR